jgi:hypothetical protein
MAATLTDGIMIGPDALLGVTIPHYGNLAEV